MNTKNTSLILAAAVGLAMATAHATQRPNVLVYVTDDFDFNEIGFFDPLSPSETSRQSKFVAANHQHHPQRI